MLRSLRNRVIAGMTVLIILVFAIAMLGVNSIDSLDRSVDRELSVLLESTDLSNGLIASIGSEVRAAEQYLLLRSPTLKRRVLDESDSAYVYQRRYRTLRALTTSDRYIVNKIAANQAEIEVAYATAHALADLGRVDEAVGVALGVVRGAGGGRARRRGIALGGGGCWRCWQYKSAVAGGWTVRGIASVSDAGVGGQGSRK